MAGTGNAQSRQDKGSGIQVTLDEPAVASQADQTGLAWGIWQFPRFVSAQPGKPAIVYSMFPDDATMAAEAYRGTGAALSGDVGKSWRRIEPASIMKDLHGYVYFSVRPNGDGVALECPPITELALGKLPPLAGRLDHGYGGFYDVRAALAVPQDAAQWHFVFRKSKATQWERIPTTIDDPAAGYISTDHQDKGHAVMFWYSAMQVLEMQDRSLLAIVYGARLDAEGKKAIPKFQSWCLRSADNGKTWAFQGVIGPDPNPPLVGFTEPTATVLPDGSLLAALRTTTAQLGSLYVSRSQDGGKTWPKPEILHSFGVLPRLLTLRNGVTVLAFGRPGAYLLFSNDGKGKRWGQLTPLVKEEVAHSGVAAPDTQKADDSRGPAYPPGTSSYAYMSRTSGYTDLLATGPDSFLVVYDQFDYPNKKGEPRKTILVRRVTVSAKGAK